MIVDELKQLKHKAGTAYLDQSVLKHEKQIVDFVDEHYKVYKTLEKKTGIDAMFFAAGHASFLPTDFTNFMFSHNIKLSGLKQFIDTHTATLQMTLAGVPKEMGFLKILYLWSRFFTNGKLWIGTGYNTDEKGVGPFAAYCLLAKHNKDYWIKDKDSQMNTYCSTIRVGDSDGQQ